MTEQELNDLFFLAKQPTEIMAVANRNSVIIKLIQEIKRLRGEESIFDQRPDDYEEDINF